MHLAAREVDLGGAALEGGEVAGGGAERAADVELGGGEWEQEQEGRRRAGHGLAALDAKATEHQMDLQSAPRRGRLI